MIFKVQNTSKHSIHPILLGTHHCGKLLECHSPSKSYLLFYYVYAYF